MEELTPYFPRLCLMIHATLFLPVDKGMLHKSVVFEGEVRIVEEIQLLKNPEPVKNLLFSSEVSNDKLVLERTVKKCFELKNSAKFLPKRKLTRWHDH